MSAEGRGDVPRDEAGRFGPGNVAALRHGAWSARVTGPRAKEIAAAFLSASNCPEDATADPLLMDAVMAWAEAAAEVERLREYRDRLDESLGAGAVDASLTEVTTGEETEVRPAPGKMRRESLSRQRESLSHALHRGEIRLRTMRNDLYKRIGASGSARPLDLAMYWAAQAEREQQR